MAAPDQIDELRQRFAAQPRRYLAPLADALRRSGAVEDAVTMLRAQLADYPDHLTGHVVLGQALFDTGALVDARQAFEAARALDPANPVIIRHLGEIASLAGDASSARFWFGRLRAADLHSDDVSAQLGGRATELPDLDDSDDATPPAIAPEQEIVPPDAIAREVPVTAPTTAGAASDDGFELLEFDPFAPEEPTFDPVVGLDVAPVVEADQPDHGIDVLAHSEFADERSGTTFVPNGATAEQIAHGPFATETMAGLLAAQGHTAQAIALYQRLSDERPDDAELRARLNAIRGSATTAGPPNAAPRDGLPPQTAPAADVTASEPIGVGPDETVDRGPGAAPTPDDDAARAAMLAAAFVSLGRGASGAAMVDDARGGRDTVAMDARDVRDDEPLHDDATNDDPFADLSFDQFFAAAEPEAPRVPEDGTVPASSAGSDDDDDLARFDAWLRDSAA